MGKLKQLWEAFNGHKTSIGAFLLTLAFAITVVESEVFVKIWEIAVPAWVNKLVLTLEWIGAVFSGVGIFHKGMKSKK